MPAATETDRSIDGRNGEKCHDNRVDYVVRYCSNVEHSSFRELSVPDYIFDNNGGVKNEYLFTRLEDGTSILGSDLENGVHISHDGGFFCNRKCWADVCSD